MRTYPRLRWLARLGLFMDVTGLLGAIVLSDTTHRLYEYRRGDSVGPYPLNALEIAVLVTCVLMGVVGPFLTVPFLSFALYFFIRLLLR